MKKLVLAILLLVAGMSFASAQVRPGMKYNELKSMYSTRGYTKAAEDVYSPGWSAFASLVIPGLGQVMSRETGRGIGFFAGSVALSAFGYYEAAQLVDNVTDANGNVNKDSAGNLVFKDENAAKKQVLLMCAAGLSELVVNIWACTDAAKVAKIKNLYNRDIKKYSFEPSFYPSVQAVQTSTGYALAPGMTFALNF